MSVAETSTSYTISLPLVTRAFSFVFMGDVHAEAANFTTTVNQVAAQHFKLIVFDGDLEDDGVISTERNPLVTQ